MFGEPKNILITGHPGSGKTTLITRLMPYLRAAGAVGFYTEEIRERGNRVGFSLVSLNGQRGILAHKDFDATARVGRYGVDLAGFDTFLERIDFASGRLAVIDEIGKMECMSERFCARIIGVLGSDMPVIGTISEIGGGIISEIKRRADIALLEVTPADREGMFKAIRERLGI